MSASYFISDDDDDDDNEEEESKQEIILPSIAFRHRKWKGRAEGLMLLCRSSSSTSSSSSSSSSTITIIPASWNKQNSVLRISFRWRGYRNSRIVIKVVEESNVLFEIEDWTCHHHHHPPSDDHHHDRDEEDEDLYMYIERSYDCSHDYIKNLKKGCHFELHYAVIGDSSDDGGGEYEVEVMDFNLSIHGKLLTDDDKIDDVMSD